MLSSKFGPTVLACCVWFSSTGNVCAQSSLGVIEEHLQSAYARVAPAIVKFSYDNFWLGSGVIVTPEGHIVVGGSAGAIIEDKLLDVRLVDGSRVPATALGWSYELGIGMLKISEPGPWPHVEMAPMAMVKPEQFCAMIGFGFLPDKSGPRGGLELHLGSVTRSATPSWFSTSHRFHAGTCSVFDLDGKLLGVNCNTPIGGDPIHASIAMINEYWDDLVAGKNLDRTRLYSLKLEPSHPLASFQPKPRAGDSLPTEAAMTEKPLAATVRIREMGDDSSNWSGVIVTPDGYIITCGHHQKLPGAQLSVSLADGRDVSATVLGTNLAADIGLVKIIGQGPWPYAEAGRSSEMQPGDPCLIIGYPVEKPGREPWVYDTKFIAPSFLPPQRDSWHDNFWTGRFPTIHIGGASGGGVFDPQGRLVGVLQGGSQMSEEDKGQMKHMRIELFLKNWEQLAASTKVGQSGQHAPLNELFNTVSKQFSASGIAVEVMADGKRKAYGTIISSDGKILTKASLLEGVLTCRLADGRLLPAQLKHVSREHDLALLEVAAADLPTLAPREDELEVGTLVAALFPTRQPIAGAISVAASPKSAESQGAFAGDGTHPPNAWCQTNIQVKKDACGAPVIDRQGRLAGILIECGTEFGSLGQRFVLPVEVAFNSFRGARYRCNEN